MKQPTDYDQLTDNEKEVVGIYLQNEPTDYILSLSLSTYREIVGSYFKEVTYEEYLSISKVP